MTGWPPGLLQDDCKKLSKWLASKPDAPLHLREAAAFIKQSKEIEDGTRHVRSCAQVCESQMTGVNPVGDIARKDCADAIRARGKE